MKPASCKRPSQYVLYALRGMERIQDGRYEMQKRKLSEEEIDQLVIAEAEDLTKWEEPVAVKPTSIRLSPSIIKKAKYLAKLLKARGYSCLK